MLKHLGEARDCFAQANARKTRKHHDIRYDNKSLAALSICHPQNTQNGIHDVPRWRVYADILGMNAAAGRGRTIIRWRLYVRGCQGYTVEKILI
ncbi:hypothetical protein KIN20_030031 [Parelaphostrongylus tenuis]|uniref:Uncharacterized protein n=1 Tax=Parelaphostrongylus tenuis TaxID=148309 RepID=A0AAD5R3F9_PARTN|nr:hypothetical protein KIN20_030031 [Parelaphostrongylus tenuis]